MCLIEIFSDESAAHSLPDEGEMRAQVACHKCRDAVLEASLVAAGKRHVVGICAYAQLTRLGRRSQFRNQQQETN
jgi:hypothetical protein